MAETTGTRRSPGDTESADTESRSAAGPDKHVHHGRTPAAWTGSLIAMAATILGGISVIMQNWVLLGVAGVIMVVGLVAAKVLQARGLGAS